MLKKSFTAPFWIMLVLGCLSGAAAISLVLDLPGLREAGWRLLAFFYLPAIMLIESIMYWIVRKRIARRKDAWRHVLLFLLAFSTPFIKSLFYNAADHFLPVGDVGTFIRRVDMIQQYLFWAIMIYAHAFFARVLIKAFAKPPVEDTGGGHLLDDVLD